MYEVLVLLFVQTVKSRQPSDTFKSVKKKKKKKNSVVIIHIKLKHSKIHKTKLGSSENFVYVSKHVMKHATSFIH